MSERDIAGEMLEEVHWQARGNRPHRITDLLIDWADQVEAMQRRIAEQDLALSVRARVEP